MSAMVSPAPTAPRGVTVVVRTRRVLLPLSPSPSLFHRRSKPYSLGACPRRVCQVMMTAHLMRDHLRDPLILVRVGPGCSSMTTPHREWNSSNRATIRPLRIESALVYNLPRIILLVLPTIGRMPQPPHILVQPSAYLTFRVLLQWPTPPSLGAWWTRKAFPIPLMPRMPK